MPPYMPKADPDPPPDRYALVTDYDGHWYVVPAGRRDEAGGYLAGADSLPDWLSEVDGPHRLTFADPRTD